MNNGLTAERMVNSFPLALQKDPKMVALAHSIANVLEQRLDEIDLGQIYTRIDQLPEDLLDILAKDFAVDWYDRSYTLEEKRKTIKGSFYVHRHRGTKAAVEKAISAIYPNPEVLEWFEYIERLNHPAKIIAEMDDTYLRLTEIVQTPLYTASGDALETADGQPIEASIRVIRTAHTLDEAEYLPVSLGLLKQCLGGLTPTPTPGTTTATLGKAVVGRMVLGTA